jgi:hypothetical protein
VRLVRKLTTRFGAPLSVRARTRVSCSPPVGAPPLDERSGAVVVDERDLADLEVEGHHPRISAYVRPLLYRGSVASIAYEDLLERLTPDARALFAEMVDAHLASGSGDRLFIRADSMSGTGLIFTGKSARRDWRNFDGGALDDLVTYGLLYPGFGGRDSPNYRISGEGLHFYRWFMGRQGGAISQVEESVQRALAGEEFAAAHPRAAHHLKEAFDLLRSDVHNDQVISEIGDHLRKSLMDTVTAVLPEGWAGQQEKPVDRLRDWVADQTDLSVRDAAVLHQLVELARVVLSLDQRLNHVRDEGDKRRSPPSSEELRRAAFTTALACYAPGSPEPSLARRATPTATSSGASS